MAAVVPLQPNKEIVGNLIAPLTLDPGADLTSTSTSSTYTHPPGGHGPHVAAGTANKSQMSLKSSISWSEGLLVLLCCEVTGRQAFWLPQ